MPIDERELYEFIGKTRQIMEDNTKSIERFGERLGEVEKFVYAIRVNGWKKPAIYAGGGGISILGLVEIFKLLGGAIRN